MQFYVAHSGVCFEPLGAGVNPLPELAAHCVKTDLSDPYVIFGFQLVIYGEKNFDITNSSLTLPVK
jgi:hypothetical protein